jgi:hypothetical protein
MDKKQGDTGESPSEAQHHGKSRHNRETTLTTKDIKYLFSGAPHFMLERAKHDLWYPQVIFPWNLHDQSIQDLWDRQPLRHESFALSTLHAHLPVPDNLTPDGVSKHQITDKQPRNGSKRPAFDADMFEVPSMLSMNGKEPGCVGFRYFLELPVADSIQNKPHLARPEVDRGKLAQLPASEAFETLQHLRDPYSECHHDMVLDRHRLICEGPRAWKRIGVREIHIKDIAERLEELGKFWTELLQEGKTTTILDKESPDTLSKNLYTNFLFPPTNLPGHRDSRHLKAQIEILTEVLAVKGAWVDFSLVEWRLRVGQILWETTPHADGDCIDPKHLIPEDDPRHLLLEQGEERKWLLLQLLLAAELLVRLDAVFRVEILQKPTHPSVTAGEMQYLDKLRHGKVNWDLVFVQRFFDNLTIRYRRPPTPPQSPSEGGQALSRTSTSDEKVSRRRSFLSRIGGFRHHQHTATTSSADTGCAWDCIIMPRRGEQQSHGLFIFADAIGWPDRDKFEETIKSKLQIGVEGPNEETMTAIYSSPIHHEQSLILEKKEMYRKGLSRQLLVLHEPRHTSDHEKAGSSGAGISADIPADIGSWMSRSWLTGLVLPGEAISHFLMATILENDKSAMAKLGPVVNLFGGFQYEGQSWWSIKCIVARVLSALDGTPTYMGWAKINVSPCDASTGQILENTWFEVDAKSPPLRAVSRIHQGSKIALESNPLGRGEVSSNTFSIPVDEAPSADTEEIAFRKLSLATIDTAEPEHPIIKGITAAREASVSFDLTTTRHVDDESPTVTTTITFPLAYSVYFISSHSCRPPPGYAHRGPCLMQKPQQSISPRPPTSSDQQQQHRSHHNHSHLPGHPLHRSYTYKYVPLTSLRPYTPPPAPSSSSESGHERSANPLPKHEHDHRHDHDHNQADENPPREPVWIIDARGSHEKEAFSRAWCAAAGTSAVVSRVGQTCLACSIREARAVDVGVVIRVGGLDK